MNAFKVTILMMGVLTAGLTVGSIYSSLTSKPHHKAEPTPVAAPAYLTRVDKFSIQDKYAQGFTSPITEGEFPKTWAKLGAERAQEATGGMWAAGYRVAQEHSCDKVTLSALSQKATADKLVFFVECENGKKYYFDEMELKDDEGRWFEIDNAPRAHNPWMSRKAFTPVAKAEQ